MLIISVACVGGALLLAAVLPRFIGYDREDGLARKRREEAEPAESALPTAAENA